MLKAEVKCLCGHTNNYESQDSGKTYACVDEPGSKKFLKLSATTYFNGFTLWACPLCNTVKGIRINIT